MTRSPDDRRPRPDAALPGGRRPRVEFEVERITALWERVGDDYADFHVEDADADEAFAHWHAACDRSRTIVDAAGSLDDTVEYRGELFSLRYVLTHMIEEYARHNGHADLLREAIDGSVGE